MTRPDVKLVLILEKRGFSSLCRAEMIHLQTVFFGHAFVPIRPLERVARNIHGRGGTSSEVMIARPKFSLHKFLKIRRVLQRLEMFYYRRVWGMDIDPSCLLALRVKLDRTHPKGVHIGAQTAIIFDVVIFAHDASRGLYLDTRIGRRCFIGARSIILPGVEIGDGSVVGAGSVVTKNVPPRCIVAGNPARIIRRDIEVGPYGRFLNADETTLRLIEAGAFSEPAIH